MERNERVFKNLKEVISEINILNRINSKSFRYDPKYYRYETCEFCGSYTTSWIMHHVSYKPELVTILCTSCHKKLHLGTLKPTGKPIRVWYKDEHPWLVRVFHVTDTVLFEELNLKHEATECLS